MNKMDSDVPNPNISNQEQSIKNQPKPKTMAGNKPVIAVLGVVALLVIIGAAYFALLPKMQKSTSTTTAIQLTTIPTSSTTTTISQSNSNAVVLPFKKVSKLFGGPNFVLVNGSTFTFITSNNSSYITLSNGTKISFGQIPTGYYYYNKSTGATYGAWLWIGTNTIDNIEFTGVDVGRFNSTFNATVSFDYPPGGYGYQASYSLVK